jgi:hypothetical protein
MSHVVFDKEIDLESFSREFKETMIKKPFLIKLLNVYTDKEKRAALVPAVVIDKLHQQFLIEISTRKDKTISRNGSRKDRRGQDVTEFDCKNNPGDES